MKKILALFLFAALPLISIAQTPQLVKDVTPGWSDTYYGETIAYKGKLLFTTGTGLPISSGHYQLWTADANNNTSLLKTFLKVPNRPFGGFKVLNDKVYFIANDSAHGEELWVTDGTSSGTEMITDINPGVASAIPMDICDYLLTIMSGKLYFAADDGVHGTELWTSDGTSSGTHMIKDINAQGSALNTVTGSFGAIIEMNNKIFFAATDSIHGRQLWMSDGTDAGTELAINMSTVNPTGSQPHNFIVYNNRVYFEASSGSNNDVYWYSSDGTNAGTQIELLSASWLDHLIFKNNLYFLGEDNNFKTGLFYDNLSYGVQEVADSFYFLPSQDLHKRNLFLTEYKNNLYFIRITTRDNKQVFQLMESDGSVVGTHVLVDFGMPPYNFETLSALTNGGDKMYFRTIDTNRKMSIWESDGTIGGTTKLNYSNISPQLNSALKNTFIISSPITIVDSNLFFSCAYDTTIGNELYKISIPYTEVKNVSGVNNDLKVYPNPTQNEITIDCPKTKMIEVFDVGGKLIYYSKLDGSPTQTVSTKHMSPGVYILRCTKNTGEQLKTRFVKE